MHERRVEELKTSAVPDLLRALATETTTLVRQEIALAKAELTDSVKAAGRGAALLAIAGVFGLGAFGALTAVLIALIALVLPLWAAALIVSVGFALIALAFAASGRRTLTHATPVAQQTSQTVKEDIEWVKTRAHSSSK